MTLLETQSSTTDWIQAFGVILGIPFTILGIFHLYRKDKDKEKQLESLGNIAKSQSLMLVKMNENVLELQNQNEVLKGHNELVRDGNQLLREQISIQYDNLTDDKVFKNKFLEGRENERKLNIRPFFIKKGKSGKIEKFQFPLRNIGERAFMGEMIHISKGNYAITSKYLANQVVEKNSEIIIFVENFDTSKVVKIEIDLFFFDMEMNKYKQKIEIDYQSIKVSNPENC